jgi:hypothetical protein
VYTFDNICECVSPLLFLYLEFLLFSLCFVKLLRKCKAY